MTSHSDCAPRCRPVAEWPSRDRAAWEAALANRDFLEAQGPAAHWAPRSRSKAAKGYSRWLAWLEQEGLLDPASAPGDRLIKERVKAYLRDLSTVNAPFTVTCRAQELYDAVRVMVPESDWTWLRRAPAVLRARAVSVRNKRARLQPSSKLKGLGQALMASAEAETSRPPLARAVRYRDGLMIALLAHRPVRLGNYAMTTIGRHLVQIGQGYRLQYAATETKTRQILSAQVPRALVPALERYLTYYRPILLSRGGRRPAAALDTLWISEVATAMAEISVHNRIRKHTAAAFGKPLPPHWFRDAAATSIAIEDPVHVHGIMNILGHASLATAEKHYIQAQTLEASRRHLDVLANLRNACKE